MNLDFLSGKNIRDKLTWMVMCATGIAILLAFAVSTASLVHKSRSDIHDQLTALADVTGRNSVTALMYLDSKAATETLAALRTRGNILHAEILDAKQHIFARYQNPAHPVSDLTKNFATLTVDVVERPVERNGLEIGRVRITAGLGDMWQGLLQQAVFNMLGLVVAGLASYFVMRRMSDLILLPIKRLAQAANEISRSRQYALRVDKTSDDELGVLTEEFNSMLGQIEHRDREMRQQTELLQSTLESIGQGFAVWDAEERLVVWNSKCMDFWYYPEGIRVGTTVTDILRQVTAKGVFGHGDAEELARKCHQYLFSWASEDEFIMADGRVIHVDRYPMPSGGRASVYTDISSRVAAEDALRQSEERWKFALEGSGDAAWDRNVQTGENIYSKRWKEMLGYVEDEIGSGDEEWNSRVHPEDLPRLMDALQAHFDGETASFASEHRMLCKDGSWKWMLTRGMLLSRDADGKPLRLVGTCSDISDRKLIQKLQIHAVLESSAEAKLLVGHDGIISFANSVAERIFGYPVAELIGLNVDVLVPTYARAGHAQHRAEFMRNPRARTIGLNQHLAAVRKDGSEFPAELALSPIRIDNRIVAMASVVDITERRQAEQAMLRAKEIAETALERAKMAERRIIDISEETRERIGQELHDDLGQHLTGVAFLSEVLNTKLKKQGWPEMELVTRITALINEAVLNTRQLAQGLYPVELKETGLQAMLEQLANQVRSIFRIKCEIDYDENFRAEGQDVAINLFRIAQEAVSNAIKHGSATRITMRTAVTPECQFFEISDNGSGIANRDGHGGLGMHTMQYRASLIGAMLSFGVSIDGGASVVVSFPVK